MSTAQRVPPGPLAIDEYMPPGATSTLRPAWRVIAPVAGTISPTAPAVVNQRWPFGPETIELGGIEATVGGVRG